MSPEVQKLLAKIWDDGIWVRIVQTNDGSWWTCIVSPLISGKYLAYAERGDDLEAILIEAMRKLETQEMIDAAAEKENTHG